VKLASIIGALYLGIYLILPGCLCQLLEAFGIEVHDQSIPAATCVISDAAGVVVCHCDHPSAKTAEVSPTEIWEKCLSPTVSKLPADALEVPPPAEVIRLNQSRAPPGLVGPQSVRTFSGVFLI
jgi:hypothetical protein